jgi:hypothetical protein
MEILVLIIVAAGILYYVYKKLDKPNADGSHPLDAPTQAPYKIEPQLTTKPDGIGHESTPIQPTISNVLDVNKDGKVDVEDVKEVVKKAKAKVKKVATKVAAKVPEKAKKPKKKKAE